MRSSVFCISSSILMDFKFVEHAPRVGIRKDCCGFPDEFFGTAAQRGGTFLESLACRA
jgi:hypothetical protein